MRTPQLSIFGFLYRIFGPPMVVVLFIALAGVIVVMGGNDPEATPFFYEVLESSHFLMMTLVPMLALIGFAWAIQWGRSVEAQRKAARKQRPEPDSSARVESGKEAYEVTVKSVAEKEE